jgi:hypothetical protein
MLVQRVSAPGSRRESWTVLGDGGPVGPIERYLAYLTDIKRGFLTVKQNDLMEVGTNFACEPFNLLEERRSAKELRHDDIVSGRQVGPRSRKSDRAGEQPCLIRLIAPAADQAPDTVDVQIERQRMRVNVHLGQLRSATYSQLYQRRAEVSAAGVPDATNALGE